MDKGRLKRFATEARNILMQGVKHRLQALGFDLKTGKPSEMPQQMEGGAVFMGDIVSADFYRRWMSLYNNVQSRSIKEVAEEAAYTWFNRFMAIRIMAKHDFIAPILEYESEDVRVPIIVSEARQGRMPQMRESVRCQLMKLLEDDSKTSEQFALLIVAFCHENPIINKCFGAIADYTELLLPQNILSEGGFVDMINHTEFITDEQYASAELIGWLYQFYISDRKDEAFAKKGKYDADEIAPATQIFTPNWIAKYMVENTVGRIYIDNNPYCEIKDELNYLVGNKPSSNVLKVDGLADLKVADLACGSGHILNECFDLLFKIYVEEGYSRRKAIEDILSKNLLGIDLDTRAKQLAMFALLMKACQKEQSFLDAKVMPRVYNMPRPIAEVIPSDWSTKDATEFLQGTIPHYMLGNNDKMTKEITDAILLMNHADTLGSIMKFDISEETRNAIMIRTQEYEQLLANGEIVPEDIRLLIPYIHIILALTDRYAAICMNPPYMGSGRFDSVLSKYVKDNYEEGKADLATVFVQMMAERTLKNGSYAFIIPPSWMFLSTFEELRKNIIENNSIQSLLHLSRGVFGADFGASSAVIQNAANKEARGTYFRLVERTFQEFEQSHLRMLFEQTLVNHDFKYRFKDYTKEVTELPYSEDGNRIYYPNVNQQDFEKIPGCPIGYWVKKPNIFDNTTIEQTGYFSGGRNKTHGNDKFVRHFWEISKDNHRWAKYSNAGGTRKYFGIEWDVVDWSKEARDFYDNHGGLLNPMYWNKEGITWNLISSKTAAFSIKHKEFIFSSGSPTIFNKENSCDYYLLGFLNSRIAQNYLKLMNPTINTTAGDVLSLPIITNNISVIKNIIKNCVKVSKQDWDAHETSWGFETNPLLAVDEETYIDNIHHEIERHEKETGERICIDPAAPELDSLEWRMEQYKQKWEHLFMQLHENEEELNRQFIDIYGLQDELTPDVPLNEITILQQGEVTIE